MLHSNLDQGAGRRGREGELRSRTGQMPLHASEEGGGMSQLAELQRQARRADLRLGVDLDAEIVAFTERRVTSAAADRRLRRPGMRSATRA